ALQVRAEADAGDAPAAPRRTRERALDQPVQRAVERLDEPYGARELERGADGPGAVPRPHGIDAPARGPGEGVPSVLSELGDERGLGEARELAERPDAEALEALDDERIDRQHVHGAAAEEEHEPL